MNQDILFNLHFKEKPKERFFKASGRFLARLPNGNENIVTTINGEIETKNKAVEGKDVIIKGIQGEEYAVPIETFYKKYFDFDTLSHDYKYVRPKIAPVYVVEHKGDNIVFIAKWGEKMICKNGDFLVSLENEAGDIYRVERDVFIKTYEKL